MLVFTKRITPEYTSVRQGLFHKWLFTHHAGLLCEENLILLSCLWETPDVHVGVYTDMCIHAAPK